MKSCARTSRRGWSRPGRWRLPRRQRPTSATQPTAAANQAVITERAIRRFLYVVDVAFACVAGSQNSTRRRTKATMPVEQQSQHRQDQQDRELAGDIHVDVHALNQHAEALLGADKLRHDGADKRENHRDLRPGKDKGQRIGQPQHPENLPFRGRQRAHQVDAVFFGASAGRQWC